MSYSMQTSNLKKSLCLYALALYYAISQTAEYRDTVKEPQKSKKCWDISKDEIASTLS